VAEPAWVVLLIGLGTFAERGSFLLLGGYLRLPDVLQRGLRYVPAAVLSALVLPGLVQADPGVGVDLARLGAGTAAILVAWRTHGALSTVAVGMATLWVLRALGL